ncbi:MAG: citrate lyase acyl carrier protein [Vagococcus sp.]|uniref:citrate lyase acyl carrier protein n=1 Tax=Vagococcus sp. TaxID=1933889 RepID=UPI002FCC4E44
MEIKKTASAGTLESSDIMITIQTSDTEGISLHLESSVEKQFGRRIKEVITKSLENLNVSSAKVVAIDKGALDCTIMARTITAVHRASREDINQYDWKEIDSWNV